MKKIVFLVLAASLGAELAQAETMGAYATGGMYDSDGGIQITPQTDGGIDVNTANISQSGYFYGTESIPESPIYYSWAGQVALDSVSMTPVLRARSAFDIDNFGNYAVTTGVSAFQGYQYTGTESRTITMNLNLHATLSEFFPLDGSPHGEGSRIFADFSVFSGAELVTENCGNYIREFNRYACGGSLASAFDTFPDIGYSGTNDNGETTRNETVSFDVNPGDTFLVYARLGAYTAGGYADAYNTFGMTFDDTTNLVALNTVPAVVPVPAAVWLFGTGLVGLIGIARRKVD